jgi:hypothetical protein
MTDQQKRIRIAEKCGWTDIKEKWSGIYGEPTELGGKNKNYLWRRVPDYLNDLNAMHEAERQILNEETWQIYRHNLTKITFNTGEDEVSATARQRADAFLLTIGEKI